MLLVCVFVCDASFSRSHSPSSVRSPDGGAVWVVMVVAFAVVFCCRDSTSHHSPTTVYRAAAQLAETEAAAESRLAATEQAAPDKLAQVKETHKAALEPVESELGAALEAMAAVEMEVRRRIYIYATLYIYSLQVDGADDNNDDHDDEGDNNDTAWLYGSCCQLAEARAAAKAELSTLEASTAAELKSVRAEWAHEISVLRAGGPPPQSPPHLSTIVLLSLSFFL